MMAEKGTPFLHDNRAPEFILDTSEPQSHKHIGRSVRGFDNTIWEREREKNVLAEIFSTFSQSPEMTGIKLLAEASPFDHVCGALASGRTTRRP